MPGDKVSGIPPKLFYNKKSLSWVLLWILATQTEHKVGLVQQGWSHKIMNDVTVQYLLLSTILFPLSSLSFLRNSSIMCVSLLTTKQRVSQLTRESLPSTFTRSIYSTILVVPLPVWVQPQCLQLLEQCGVSMLDGEVQALDHLKHVYLGQVAQDFAAHLLQTELGSAVIRYD